MSKRLAIMEKKIFESEVACNELVEGFDNLKAAHQKNKAELAWLKAGLAEEKMAAEEKELELLTAQNVVRAEIIRLLLENRELQKKLQKENKVMD